MKLKLKMIATAAAMVSMVGAAHATLTGTSSNNGSVFVFAFDSTNNAYYVRDLGFLMNDFLPNSVTTSQGNGGVTGTLTPTSGLTLNASNTANFGDSNFATWYAAQDSSNTFWALGSYDNQGTGGSTNNTYRSMISSAVGLDQFFQTNQQINNYASSGGAGGTSTIFASADVQYPGGISASGVNANLVGATDINYGYGAQTMQSVGQAAQIYYFTRNPATGGGPNPSDVAFYTNGNFPDGTPNLATVTLSANGDFTYALAPTPAVPLPPTAWTMGAGLVAMAGLMRRRKTAVSA